MADLILNIIFGSHLDITSTQILGCGISLAVALYLAQRWMNGDKESSPLVPYRFPIIGSTFEWNANPAKFIKDATEKYGSVFRIYINGRVQTIVGKDLVRNIVTNEDFNFIEAFHDIFDIDYMLRDGKKMGADLPNLITKNITPNLKAYTPRVVRKLYESMDNWLGGVQDSITMENPVIMIQDMIANASASVFVGEELCNNKEFIHTSKVVTTDIGNILLKIGLIGLMPRLSILYQRFLFTFMNPASKHIAVVCRVTGPEVERRMKEAREQGDSWNRPRDILQDMIDQLPSDLPAPFVTKTISNNFMSLIFASIHTTTQNSSLVLYALADYEEYVQELLDEQKAVLAEGEAEEPGVEFGFSSNAIKKMAKLDSFLREFDEELQGPDPENFNPWRFVNKNKQASKVGIDFLRFGMGKHACPGRFFAIQEIKTIVSIIMRKYRIVRPNPSVSRSIKDPPQGPLMFIKRE
ncbi:cytochrome P450 [Jimgerdemannia flammicorona]|uniref:Cytochrome P450 n=1 Tax=Jimgerdemannia flammicorona TaxID=994334 RepID=A0A433D9P3_9FUNG|nr:cytochrome P450 [Jimgerdemannia flammicorona]